MSSRINPDPAGSTPYRRARQAGNVLLYLPREIRDNIYSYHIEVETVTVSNPARDFVFTPLMRTCKQAWLEIQPIRLNSCYFLLNWHSHNDNFAKCLKIGFRQQKRFTVQNITRIRTPNLGLFMVSELKALPKVRQFWFEFIASCVQLRQVDVYSRDFFLKPAGWLTQGGLGDLDFSCLFNCKSLRHMRFHMDFSEPVFTDRALSGFTSDEIISGLLRIKAKSTLDFMKALEKKFGKHDRPLTVSCHWMTTKVEKGGPSWYIPSIFGRNVATSNRFEEYQRERGPKTGYCPTCYTWGSNDSQMPL